MIRLILEKRHVKEGYGKPCEGIFWYIDNKIVAYMDPVGFNTDLEHVKMWKCIKHLYGDVPFDYYPRGRVMVNEVRNSDGTLKKYKAFIYIDDCINNSEIIDDIKRRNSENECFQFAYGFDVNIDIKDVSLIDTLQYGILYRVGVKSNNAYSINIIFSNYFVPDGAKMFLYNEKQDVILGAYTSNNNKKDQIFATSPISGDKIFIEYFEPRFSEISGQVVIGKVSHDFIGITESYDKTQAGSCEVDVNCIEGEDWQDEKRAVCRLLFNGAYLCSGSLINNVERDGKAYLLTANHCISTQSDASSCVFYFNYEKPDCGFGSGSLSQSISGSYLRAAMSSSDFTLLELSRIPYNSFNPYYAGWDRNETQTAGGVGIHHPQGGVKKISTFNIVPATSDCFFTNNFIGVFKSSIADFIFKPNSFILFPSWTKSAFACSPHLEKLDCVFDIKFETAVCVFVNAVEATSFISFHVCERSDFIDSPQPLTVSFAFDHQLVSTVLNPHGSRKFTGSFTT